MNQTYPSASSISMNPGKASAYRLLHEGTEALAQVEANGIRIDEAYLNKTKRELDKNILNIKAKLMSKSIWSDWKKHFGANSLITSGEQLAHIVFNVQGHKATSFTASGGPSSDEAHLSTVNSSFIKGYLKLSKLVKARNTYIEGISRETINGYLHPVFNLHIARTYRSSSDSPNFQNMPIRNPFMGKLIRRCFIPRPGGCLVEVDYSGVEVSVAACYHKDPMMLKYILDPKTDMHRDMAAQIYNMGSDSVTKMIRHAGKNKFVFPQFYGDYYINSAKAMWDTAEHDGLLLADGTPLMQHLKASGIHSRGACDPSSKQPPKKGTFEHHMKFVEDDFWNRRFKVYGQWKKDWMADYRRTGGFDTLTGFHISGAMSRNDVINYPVQGSAFHCLLWSLTKLNTLLRKYKMKAKIIGQIHDSIVADVPADELQDYLHLVREVMTVKVNKYAPWLIVPLQIEADVTPIDASWHEKQEVSFEENLYSTEHKVTKEKGDFRTALEMLHFMRN